MKHKRPKLGDVIEITTKKGFAYAQYTHKNAKYGSLIRVLPNLYKKRPSNFSVIIKQPERFFTFFPLGAAVWRGIVLIVANEEIPEHAKPFPLFKVAGAIDNSGRVLNWWLWDGEHEWKVDTLTQEQRNLSIAEIMNDTALIESILEGWTPADRA